MSILRTWWQNIFGNSSRRARREYGFQLVALDTKETKRRQRQSDRPGGRKQRRRELLEQVDEYFSTDFLGAEAFYRDAAADVIQFKEFEARKVAFVQDWFRRNSSFPVSDEQAAAIGAVNGNIQVIARAGSGKTATIVNRAYFLNRHCGVEVDEMLLLAFNRKAAEEMADRLEALCGARPPHCMTFHALAYAIVHPEESLLGDSNGAEDSEVAMIIGRALKRALADRDFEKRVSELMIAHYEGDAALSAAVVGFSVDGKTSHIIPATLETFQGEYVKSSGERLIANFLFRHGLEYKYEKNYWWKGVNYRPDFTIIRPGGRHIIIEYFGRAGDPDYDAQSEAKRKYWRERNEFIFLEYSANDLRHLKADGFQEKMASDLTGIGLHLRTRADAEIWESLRPRALKALESAIRSFINRARTLNLTPAELQAKCQAFEPEGRAEALFLQVVSELYGQYIEEIARQGKDDFNGLLSRAVTRVENGNTVFVRRQSEGDLRRMRFLFIDEFQDFSLLFHNLTAAIREANPALCVFCVGDDWQSINGFAGADLTYFSRFTQTYPDSRALQISTNYRSSREIVELGNVLMRYDGEAARAHHPAGGETLVCFLDKLQLSAFERDKFGNDPIIPAVLRLTSACLAKGRDVVLLARRNGLPSSLHFNVPTTTKSAPGQSNLDVFLGVVRAEFTPEEAARISISTAHGYKGLQKPAVIVLDAVSQSYPLIHPSWIFLRILGESLQRIVDEERRLLYVALTRAESHLYIVTNDSSSPFLSRLYQNQHLKALDWERYPPRPGPNDRYIISVANDTNSRGAGTYAIKELLKEDGFRWEQTTHTWSRTIAPADATAEALGTLLWWYEADGVEVTITASDQSVVEVFNL